MPKYEDKDRYQDFRQLFTETEQGKRVFQEILAWGKIYKPSITISPVDPYMLAFKDGERNIALKLLTTVNHEPPEKPKQPTRKQTRK